MLNTTDLKRKDETDLNRMDETGLPTFEEGKKSSDSLLDGTSRESTDVSSSPTLFWLLHRSTGIITGDRWKRMDGKKKAGTECSFICNATNSDVAFAICLLKHHTMKEQINAADAKKQDSPPVCMRKVWVSTTLGRWNANKKGTV